jgi:hypothetical protein
MEAIFNWLSPTTFYARVVWRIGVGARNTEEKKKEKVFEFETVRRTAE